MGQHRNDMALPRRFERFSVGLAHCAQQIVAAKLPQPPNQLTPLSTCRPLHHRGGRTFAKIHCILATMTAYKEFIFDSFSLDPATRQIKLNYSFDNQLHFTETLTLPADMPLHNADSPDVQRALFALHLAGGVSYYKAFCPPVIRVNSGELSEPQAAFWDQFYTNGLGEFFYQNKLDFRDFIYFPVTGKNQPLVGDVTETPQKTLLPFGGGKDSIVTLEILKKQNIDITLFRLRAHHYINELAALVDLPLLNIERQLDAQLFELNKQGAYNGHVPITGYITFLSIVIALLSDHDSVAFSNERSADYGSVTYLGTEINHQWSKGLEAEQLITSYLGDYVTKKVRYLNPLRPLSELKIAQLFAKYPKYFTHTTSCNQNWLMLDKNPHQGAWCGKCNKCAFIFAMYAGVLPGETAVKIYGQNMFNNPELLHTFRQLWGTEGIKPFDCVGTPEEMQAAMYLALKKPDFANTVIGHDFTSQVQLADPEKLVAETLQPNFVGVPEITHHLLKEFA